MGKEGSPSAEPPAESVARRRGRRWALAGFVLLAALAGAFASRERWAGPLLVRYVRGLARRELGAELSIERVSGGWWRDVTFEGVRWRSASLPLRRIDAARVELEFRAGGLLRGLPGLAVRVHGRGIELATTAQGAGGGPLPELPYLELELEEVLLQSGSSAPVHLGTLSAAGRLQANRAQLDRLAASEGENRLLLTDAVVDLPGRSLLELARSLRGSLTATLPDARRLLGPWNLPVRSAELQLACADGSTELTGALALDGGTLQVRRGRLSLPASDAWTDLELDLDLAGAFSDLAPFGAWLGEDLAGRWGGSIRVQGPLRALTGRFSGHGDELRVRGVPLEALDVDVQTDGELARFERCEISGPALEAVLRGGVRLEPLELVDVGLNVSADAASLRALLPFPCEHAFLHARLSGPPRAASGAFEASATGASLGGLFVDDAEVRGRLVAGALAVDELHLTSGETVVEAAGSIRPGNEEIAAELEELALLWRGTRVDLEQGARFRFAPGRFALEGLALTSAGPLGAGRAQLALEQAGGTTRGSLEFSDYDAGPLLAPFLPSGMKAGRIRGSVRGALGSGADAAADFALALEGWSVSAAWPELSGELRGDYRAHELALERLELGFAADEAARAEGSARVPIDPLRPLALAPGPLELHLEGTTADLVQSLRRAGIDPGLSATGPCRLALDATGEWSRLAGGLTFALEKATLGREARARTADLEGALSFGERVAIERMTLSAPSGTITLRGSLDAAPDIPRWLSDRLALLEAPLALEAHLDLADIAWLAGLSSELRRTSGQLAGRVAIGGTALAPHLTGALELSAGELRLSSSANPVRNLAAQIALEDDIVRIVALTGEVGGAPVSVTGTIEPFGPFRRMDLSLAGKNLLLKRDSHLRLRADAELVIKGTPSQLTIGGNLDLAEGTYTGEISPLEEIVRAGRRTEPQTPERFTLWPSGFLADAELDLHLGGAQRFEYRTNLLQASLRPDAWLRGTGAFPVLEGPVYVDAARLTLPSGVMKLVSGLLTFRREAPLRPELQLTSEMRVQRHDVRVVTTGTFDRLEFVPSSTPPLPEDDLRVLVLTGQLPVARGTERNSAAMEALAVFLARDALVRWFGSDDYDSENLLERFEIEVGAKTSESGQPTGRVLFYLRPQSRRSGRATYLSAEIDEHDRVNYALGIVFRPR